MLGITETDWTAFIRSIPFNIYSILAVLFVPVIAYTGYEFSAMAKAEKRVQETGEKYWKTSKPMRKSDTENIKESKASLVFVPLLVLFVTLFGILAPLGFPFTQVPGGVFRSALSTGYLLAAAVLVGMMV
ncbi:MAG TPA: Na+/H+ antiporter NhaC family protein, partial [Bacteroidales bacterium]|nr:Na+/H+ antiporter NhaC family protein [Bacteroidales bacterium]